MDPLEVIDLCRRAAHKGAPKDVFIPLVFGVGDYQNLWKNEPKKVRNIIDDLLCAAHPDEGLELLLKFNVIYALFPELSAIRGMGDADGLHKDVWSHTKAVVNGVPNLLELRWGALLHDIGKVKTRRILNNGRVTFHNHDRVGARMVDSMQTRTNLFQDDVGLLRTVRLLVLHHLRPAGYKASWTDSAVRRLVTECGDPRFFEKLMHLSHADLTTKVPARRDRALARSAELEARVAKIIELDNAPKLPKGTMGMIMEKTPDRKPGAWLTDLRSELENRLLDKRLLSGQGIQYYVDAALDILNDR
jgi:poly(A) polymerase